MVSIDAASIVVSFAGISVAGVVVAVTNIAVVVLITIASSVDAVGHVIAA